MEMETSNKTCKKIVQEIDEERSTTVILDISGVYVQIYDQGYFNQEQTIELKNKYNDVTHWRVVTLDI